MAWTLTDGVLTGILLVSLILGVWRGLVHELMSLAGWFAAFAVAQWLATDVADWLPVWREAAQPVRYGVSFVLVFVLSLFAVGLLSWLLRKVVETSGLLPVDRSLGALFGLVRGLVLLLALTVAVHLLGLRSQAWWQQSHTTPWLEVMLAGVKPVLPAPIQTYLP